MAAKITAGIATQALTQMSATQRHQLELCVSLDDGGEAMYVQFDESIDPYGYVMVNDSGKATYGNTSLVAEYRRGGWVQVTAASGQYGWVQCSGRPIAKCAANCADNVPLFVTATDGVIDDATLGTAVQGHILGAVGKTTISNATAVTLHVARGQMTGQYYGV